jgi:hypothetical protein
MFLTSYRAYRRFLAAELTDQSHHAQALLYNVIRLAYVNVGFRFVFVTPGFSLEPI